MRIGVIIIILRNLTTVCQCNSALQGSEVDAASGEVRSFTTRAQPAALTCVVDGLFGSTRLSFGRRRRGFLGRAGLNAALVFATLSIPIAALKAETARTK